MARRNSSANYLSFPFGETVVTLAENRGKLGSNQWGDFFSRNFTEPAGKFSCCSPDLERLIVDSGAKRGSVISVVKEKYGAGAIWRVKLLGSSMMEEPTNRPTKNRVGGGSVSRTQAADEQQPVKVNGHAASVDHAWRDVPHSRIPPTKYAHAPADAQLEEKLRESIAMVQTAQAVESLGEPKNLLERAAQAAVDAAIYAESYAAKHGKVLQIPPESIAAWASTLFINARSH